MAGRYWVYFQHSLQECRCECLCLKSTNCNSFPQWRRCRNFQPSERVYASLCKRVSSLAMWGLDLGLVRELDLGLVRDLVLGLVRRRTGPCPLSIPSSLGKRCRSLCTYQNSSSICNHPCMYFSNNQSDYGDQRGTGTSSGFVPGPQ